MDIINAKKGCLYIIGHVFRPCTLTFLTELEERYYTPDTPMNDLFNLFNVTYEGGMHYVIEIPAGSEYFEQVKIIADENNLNVVNGKPFNGIEEFPVNCLADHCFVLENKEHNITWEGYKQELQRLWVQKN